MGVNGGRGVSGWVAAQTLAASWDNDLIGKQYAAMAREFRSKGYSMQLGPVTGPMGRSPLGGRNFESFVSPAIAVHNLPGTRFILTSSPGLRSIPRRQIVRFLYTQEALLAGRTHQCCLDLGMLSKASRVRASSPVANILLVCTYLVWRLLVKYETPKSNNRASGNEQETNRTNEFGCTVTPGWKAKIEKT